MHFNPLSAPIILNDDHINVPQQYKWKYEFSLQEIQKRGQA